MKKHASNHALGERPTDRDGTAGPYQWETYEQVGRDVARIGTAISQLNLGHSATISIFGINSASWVKAMLAVWRQGHLCVPLYDTLGAESTSFILNDAQVRVVFCAAAKLQQVVDVVGGTPVTTIIQFEPVSSEDRKKVRREERGERGPRDRERETERQRQRESVCVCACVFLPD